MIDSFPFGLYQRFKNRIQNNFVAASKLSQQVKTNYNSN